MSHFAIINLRTLLCLVSILVSQAHRSISILRGGGGIPLRLSAARTAEIRPFLLFGPANGPTSVCNELTYTCTNQQSVVQSYLLAPLWSSLLTSAPFSTRHFTVFTWPSRAAQCRGDHYKGRNRKYIMVHHECPVNLVYSCLLWQATQ